MAAVEYQVGGLSPVLSIAGDGRIEAALGRILAGWALRPVRPDAPQEGSRLTVEQVAEGWLCSGDAFGETVTYRDPVAAGCGIIAALFKAHTYTDVQNLCVHAAAVRFGAGVALLTGDYRAGKSILAAACCAAGNQVFSDDIVPLVRGGAVARAPGLAFRLRLPLPERLDDATAHLVVEHTAIESSRYAYVRPPEALLARHGAEAPVGAIVTIERRETGTAQIARMEAGYSLGELIRRNFARELPAGQIIRALDRLVVHAPCLRLVYSDPAEAAALMQRVFASEATVTDTLPTAAAATSRVASKDEGLAALLPEAMSLSRVPGVGMHRRDGSLFLTDADEIAIHGLNATGAAVWRLIDLPLRFGEIVETFAAAFPERPRAALSDDLAALALDLVSKGLATLGEGDRLPPPQQASEAGDPAASHVGTARASGGSLDDPLLQG